MPNAVRDLWANASGSATIEYGLVVAFVAIVLATGFSVAAQETAGLWIDLERQVSEALAAAAP